MNLIFLINVSVVYFIEQINKSLYIVFVLLWQVIELNLYVNTLLKVKPFKHTAEESIGKLPQACQVWLRLFVLTTYLQPGSVCPEFKLVTVYIYNTIICIFVKTCFLPLNDT